MIQRIWLNGQVIPMAEARIGVEDRGFQFADGVYEVVRIYDGRCFALREHLQRLQNSADAIQLAIGWPVDELSRQIARFVAADALRDGMVYAQVTRGCSPRNHVFPDCAPTVLFYTRPLPPVPPPGSGKGEKLMTLPDERWKKCWIKSTALLPNVMAKNQAVRAGADEAAFVEEGDEGQVVTECSTTNLFAVVRGTLITHPAGARVLPGITRAFVIDVAKKLKIPVEERPPLLTEVEAADEVFITGTTREIVWVSHWNDRRAWPVCGPVALRLHHALRDAIAADVSGAGTY
jgi:D-alanine transaminase